METKNRYLVKAESSIVSVGSQLLKFKSSCLANYYGELREWWSELNKAWRYDLLSSAGLKDINSEVKLSTPSDIELDRILLLKDLELSIFEDHLTLQPLNKLSYLQSLSIKRNESIHDLEPLKSLLHLRELTCIDLYKAGEKLDFTSIGFLHKLSMLDISHNNIKSLEFLLELPNLQKLYLRGTDIEESDLLIIGRLKGLVSLNIKRTEIKNISPLFELRNLKYLYCETCYISEEHLNIIKANNPECKILDM